jgi:carbamoyl-phosphate synthase large subunit
MIKNGQIQMIINTPDGMIPRRDENQIRAVALAHSVCIMTTITGADAAINGIKALQRSRVGVKAIQHYRGNVKQL